MLSVRYRSDGLYCRMAGTPSSQTLLFYLGTREVLGSTSKDTIYFFVCYSCTPFRGATSPTATPSCDPFGGRNVPYNHSYFMDGLDDACKVPCFYHNFGCERYVDLHSLAEHSSRCAHAPCYCYECMPPFEGSQRASCITSRHHLSNTTGPRQ